MNFLNDIAALVIPYLSNTLMFGLPLAAVLGIWFWVNRKINATTKYVVWYGSLVLLVMVPLMMDVMPQPIPAIPSSPESPIKITVDVPEEDSTLLNIKAESPELGPLETTYVPLDTESEPVFGFPQQGYGIKLLPPSTMTWNLPQLLGSVLFGLWVLGVFVGFVPLVQSLLYLRKLKQKALPLKTHQEQLQGWMDSHEIRRPIRLMTSSKVNVPMSLGFVRPVILMPDFLINQLTPAEVDQVLLHEIAHLKRRDDWSKLLQKMIRVLFFFHPAVWWMDRQLDAEREVACDDWVAQATQQRRNYAACLVRLVEIGLHRPKLPVQLGLMMASKIESRIKKLIDRKRLISIKIPIVKLAVGFALLMAASIISLNFFPNIAVGNESFSSEFDSSFGVGAKPLDVAAGTELIIELPMEAIHSFKTNSAGTTLMVENLIAVVMNHPLRFEFKDNKLLAKVWLPETQATYAVSGIRDFDLQDPAQPQIEETITAIRSFSIDDIALKGYFNILTGPSLDKATTDLRKHPTIPLGNTILIQPLKEDFGYLSEE